MGVIQTAPARSSSAKSARQSHLFVLSISTELHHTHLDLSAPARIGLEKRVNA
jgi:hypothetical protein